jgi:hypothetical protein
MDPIISDDEATYHEPIEVVAAADDDERQYPEFVDKWDWLDFTDYDGDDVTGAQFEDTEEEEESENIAIGWMSKEKVRVYPGLSMTEIIHP